MAKDPRRVKCRYCDYTLPPFRGKRHWFIPMMDHLKEAHPEKADELEELWGEKLVDVVETELDDYDIA